MSARWTPCVAIAMALLALGLSACGRGPRRCPVCERKECAGMSFRITMDDGSRVETCCARCGLLYLESAAKKARLLQATDFAGGGWIDAKQAAFVSGSDVSACSMKETRRDAYGCCTFKQFDRCLPSLIAFHSRAAAAAFQKEHGGDIVGLDQVGKQEAARAPDGL